MGDPRMTVATRSLSISQDCAGIGLIEALQEFGRSRATKALIRYGNDRDVRCDLRVPLLEKGSVAPRVLGRALRRLCRETIDNAQPGDRAVVDFALEGDAALTLTVSDYRAAGLPEDLVDAVRPARVR